MEEKELESKCLMELGDSIKNDIMSIYDTEEDDNRVKTINSIGKQLSIYEKLKHLINEREKSNTVTEVKKYEEYRTQILREMEGKKLAIELEKKELEERKITLEEDKFNFEKQKYYEDIYNKKWDRWIQVGTLVVTAGLTAGSTLLMYKGYRDALKLEYCDLGRAPSTAKEFLAHMKVPKK